MKNHVRWLHDQLPSWETQGVVTPLQADRIRQLYPAPAKSLPWAMLIFSGIGAVIIGFGVILLFAYNWQAIPKMGKLGLIFGAIVGVHGSGWWLSRRDDWRRQLGEALSVLGTMLFGAGIWLVAQIYHIDEHYPNGFLLWSLGALAMAWATPSVAHGLLAALLLAIWGGCEALGFDRAVHWGPLLLAGAVGGLAVRVRSTLLLGVALAGLNFLLVVNAVESHHTLAFPTAIHTAVLLVGLAILVEDGRRFPESAAVLNFFGWTGFLVVTYLLTFHPMVKHALGWFDSISTSRFDWLRSAYGWGPFVLMGAVWAWVAGRARLTRDWTSARGERWLLPMTAVLCQTLAVGLPVIQPGLVEANEVLLAAIFNLIFLAIAVMWMVRGCREGEIRTVVLGSTLLVALMTARFFDLLESLALRGVFFLAVGGVLFAEGFFYRRARERAGQEATR